MIALFKKELRGHLPLLALVVVLFGGDFLYWPFAERLDELTWVEQSGQLQPGEGKAYGFVLLALTLVAAYSAFPREHDEKTIEFLYALPVTRSQIFLAKALAVWSVMVVGVGLDHLAGAVAQALNPQSLVGDQWRFGLAAQVALLDVFFCAVMVAHGLLISFLRRFGLIVAALVGYIVLQIKRHSPAHAYFDPSELLALEYQGINLVVPWTGILFHTVVALLSGLLAYTLWMGSAERLTAGYNRLRSHRAGRVALGCVPLLLASITIGWFMTWAIDEAENTEQVVYREFLPVRAESVWYDFTYDSSQTAAAQSLIRQADAIYEQVAAALGAEVGPRIDADLTDLGLGHAGIAQGGVIRIALETLDADDALHTLYHETAHSFQFQLAGGRVPEQAESIRFFIEGGAEYVAMELRNDPAARRAHRRLAAAAFDRHNIRFEELIDDTGFKTVHDANLVYVLGETWTAALVESCDPLAPGRFFRALDRQDAPEDLSGITLWQDTLQAAGCALEPAVAIWGERMTELVAAEREFLDQLPSLGGGVIGVKGGVLTIQASFDRPLAEPADSYYLRIRRDASVPLDQTYTLTAVLSDDDETDAGETINFQVPANWVGDGTFELQLGQSIPDARWPFFEDWQSVTTSW